MPGFRCPESCILTRVERLGQDVEKFPSESLRFDEFIKLAHHLCIVGLGVRVNGNHARGIAHAEDELPCHLPVDVSCKCGEELDVGDVLLVVEDALVEV